MARAGQSAERSAVGARGLEDDRGARGDVLPLADLLVGVDEHTRECLAIDVALRLNRDDVQERLAWRMATRGVPEHIRSENGPEFTAKAARAWLGKVGVRKLFIEPGSPWENGYCESLNGKLRDELLDQGIFYTLTEARVLIERWRRHYNTERPHWSRDYRPPAPETRLPEPCSAAPRRALVPGAGLT